MNEEQRQKSRDWALSARKMWCAVVLAAIDDAVVENTNTRLKNKPGSLSIKSWLNSRDGREVLMSAGVDPDKRVTKGIIAFVERGVRPAKGLTLSISEASQKDRKKRRRKGPAAG